MAHLPSSALSYSFRARLPSRLRLPSMAQISACVSVTASGVDFGSTDYLPNEANFFSHNAFAPCRISSRGPTTPSAIRPLPMVRLRELAAEPQAAPPMPLALPPVADA